MNNIAQVVVSSFQQHAEKVMMRIYRKETWVNFTGKECNEIIKKIGISLLREGNDYKNVGIYSQNMPEWSLVDFGAVNIGCPSVPIYATNIWSQTGFIVKDAAIEILFVGEQEQYDEVMKMVEKEDIYLKRIVVFSKDTKLESSNSVYFEDWIESEENKNYIDEQKERINAVKQEDLATIIYTSGTTGTPKGVMLSHANFLITLKDHVQRFELNHKEDSMSFLPLSHIFERAWAFLILASGMSNTYMTNPKEVAEMLLLAKPSAMCSVPRLYEKIYHMAIHSMNNAPFVKKKMFFWALNLGRKTETLKQEGKRINLWKRRQLKIAEKLVYSKFREKLGGRLKFLPCGGARVPDDVVLFFRAVGLPIIVGYGLTETTATVTSFVLDNYKVGTVGKLMASQQVKIGENDEILVKGGNVMMGYYKNKEETDKVFDDEGWFKTGDAGYIDEDGNLVITDRIKELIKTAGGKYIAPQQVETLLTNNTFVEHAILVGESKPYAVTLFVPNFEVLEEWAKENKISYTTNQELIENPAVINLYEDLMNKGQENLAKFEKAKKFRLIAHELSMETGELTPTLKVKRKIIDQKYKHLIDSMYA